MKKETVKIILVSITLIFLGIATGYTFLQLKPVESVYQQNDDEQDTNTLDRNLDKGDYQKNNDIDNSIQKNLLENEELNNSSQEEIVGNNVTVIEQSINTKNIDKDFSNNSIFKDKEVKAKGLYLTGWTVGDDNKLDKYINIANTTQVNSYVVDIKDDDGNVGYVTDILKVKEVDAYLKKYDVDKVIKAFHDNDIYVIGRLVCFKDPILSVKRPDLAIKHINGDLWKDRNGCTWLNPYEKENWEYLIDIAEEAIFKGFDEIQFDYIRFANDGDKKLMDFSSYDKQKYEVINDFLSYARERLPNGKLSADVFGIILESPEDTEQIGQYLEKIGMNIDYISPMIYPSHYAVGQIINGKSFYKPDLEPYEVVHQAMLKGIDRISKVDGYKANIRPYIQDFTAYWLGNGYYQSYGDKQLREQIKAVEDTGIEQWLVWNPFNNYSLNALDSE